MSSKRRRQPRPPGPFASSMPKIRDWVVDVLRWERDYVLDMKGRADDFPGVPREDFRLLEGSSDMVASLFRAESNGLQSDDGQLWWVTKRMAMLAAEAATSMPEWTPTAARPSRFGVVWWEGGAGFDLPAVELPTPMFSYPRAYRKDEQVMGCVWSSFEDGSLALTPITLGQVLPSDMGTQGPFGTRLALPSRTQWSGDGAEMVGVGERLWPMLGATWLLAQSPTVGVTHGVRYDRWDPERPFAKPSLPSVITVVTLREADKGKPILDPPGMERKQLDHQILVRGHWRQQPCGPKRRWKKPVFIAPHVRGPAGTELVIKPVVHVWKR